MLPAYAEIFLLCAACAILLIDLFAEKWRSDLTYGLSILALAGTAVCTFAVTAATGGQPAYTFNAMLVSDLMANVLKIVTYLAVALAFVYSRSYLKDRELFRG